MGTEAQRDPQLENPQGLTGTWYKPKGRKGAVIQSWDMAEHAGTCHRVQRRATEAGVWRLQVASRWMALRARIVGGERVQERGCMATKTTDEGAVG